MGGEGGGRERRTEERIGEVRREGEKGGEGKERWGGRSKVGRERRG